MPTVYFATTSQEKTLVARTVCAEAGITVEQVVLDIDEIQGEDPKVIVKDKARRAYEQLGKPVVVSDDSWNIPALNGFPGPYMKSINHWFTPEDFLRLMHGIKDRTVIIHQYLAYTDGKTIKIFKNDLPGQIIHMTPGKNQKPSITTIILLDADNGKTMAEVFERGGDAFAARYENGPDAWHQFVTWYTKNPA